jgi:hypothetical protein
MKSLMEEAPDRYKEISPVIGFCYGSIVQTLILLSEEPKQRIRLGMVHSTTPTSIGAYYRGALIYRMILVQRIMIWRVRPAIG